MNTNGVYLEAMESNKGKVLAIDINGEVTYEDRSDQPEKDKLWIKLPLENNTFYLISSKYNLALHYSPNDGEQIYGIPFSRNTTSSERTSMEEVHTKWGITEDGNIFTLDPLGDKRFLWSIPSERSGREGYLPEDYFEDDILKHNVYVTPDEYVAESWTIVPPKETYSYGQTRETNPSRSGSTPKIFVYMWFILFLFTLFIMFQK